MLNPKSHRSAVIIAAIILLAAGSARSIENDPNQSGITMEFVRIPAGSFYIKPAHHVQFIKPFYMSKYEVTQAQWKAVMGTTVTQQRNKIKPSWNLKGVGPEHPIYCITLEEAVEFCKRLGTNFRLPSETEWEYACRAGSKTSFHYGDDPDYSQLDSYAWYYVNSKGSTHPVGRKKSNKWGLYDMHGNVSEWCSDRFGSGDYVVDVCRGGSWCDEPKRCRSAQHDTGRGWPDEIGFRVVFTGKLDNDKKIWEITLPKETTGITIAQEQKPEIKPVTRMAIIGVVRDQAGIPIEGVYMQIPPLPSDWHLREYPEGKFEAYHYTNRSQTSIGKYHFYARHTKRNLVAFVEFNEDVNNLDIKLKPGAILTGKVVDAYGKAIQGTEISLHSQYVRKLPLQSIVEPDMEGKFEIKSLPLGHKYRLTARAMGYRMRKIEVSSGNAPGNRIDAGPIVLARGQFSVSGVVVDRKGKPVANASVHCTGENQVDIHTKTDVKGRFKADGIFEGPVIINANTWEDNSGLLWYGQRHSYSRATNVKIVLRQKTNYGRRKKNQ
ncbi:MAG: SUMF1/EgtB/PvdO family nonheme iron enzyme [Planctomycetes bacterium]|nr:SUMF1/EgtB/PvdO family nonheme iron enzyme [Planctomycetota bacterium]